MLWYKNIRSSAGDSDALCHHKGVHVEDVPEAGFTPLESRHADVPAFASGGRTLTGVIPAPFQTKHEKARGFSLIEVLVASAIFLIVFVGLAKAFSMSLAMIESINAKTGAVTLAQQRIEYIKSLSYGAVGTLGGIPSGDISQSEMLTYNSIDYTRKTLIKYIDDPSDGLGMADANGITADYKNVKVTIRWTLKGRGHQASFVTNVAPNGIETITGGGTLRVQAIDATANPVPAAKVTIQNTTLSPPVDVTVTTNPSGSIIFPGSPSGASYQVSVTKSGYSTAKTYPTTATNIAPDPGHLTVAAGTVTTATFKIDELSSMRVHTYEAYADTAWKIPFDTTAMVATSSNVHVLSGELTLEKSSGVYDASGVFTTIGFSPDYLGQWEKLVATSTVPAGTSVNYHVYYKKGFGTYELIPDTDLSGNASGFTSLPVDLSSLSIDKYRKLRVQADLGTTVSTSTPQISSLSLRYHGGPVAVPNIAFEIRGEKTIGVTASSTPIYKFSVSTTTDASGVREFPKLEWDAYHFSVGGYDIAGLCPSAPVSLLPGASIDTMLILAPDTAHSLLVSVSDPIGSSLPDALVTISGGGSPDTEQTTSCGQVYFSGLSGSATYTLTVSDSSYGTTTVSGISVSGETKTEVIMNP